MQRIWNIAKPQPGLQKLLKEELKISFVLAQLLINRNISEPQRAALFLNPRLSGLLPAEKLPDITIACQRIKKAIKDKERVLIFGDYDADGITSTVLLELVLRELGLRPLHYLPHRINEGYGLSQAAVDFAKKQKVDLFISVDCGTNNFAEIEELNRIKIDTIVIDHHQPTSPTLPGALAIVNPKRKDSHYVFQDLAAVGVVYKVCQALTGGKLENYLDLVCLGTVADVVPLQGENRIIVKKGLEVLNRTENHGLRALIEQSGIRTDCLDTAAISYIIAPRINASGRIDSAEVSYRLLSAESAQVAREQARIIGSLNTKRQGITEQIFKEAQDIIEKEINFKEHKVIVIAKDGWHQGVLGIVAAKIKDLFHRPSVVISTSGNLCRGSARSINNFHILEALLECKDILKSLGGHQRAAGLVIEKENIRFFRDRINLVAQEKLHLEDLYPYLNIEMELSFEELSSDLIEEIHFLEPFGEANPEPIFYTSGLYLKSPTELFNRDTLKFWVTDEKLTYPVVGFSMANLRQGLENARCFDLAYSICLDRWHQPPLLQLNMEDARIFNYREL